LTVRRELGVFRALDLCDRDVGAPPAVARETGVTFSLRARSQPCPLLLLWGSGLASEHDGPYEKPGNAFVAGFIGSPAMNLLNVTLTEDGVKFGNTNLRLAPDTRKRLGNDAEAILGVRPEDFRVVSENDEGVLVHVNVIEELGADAYVYADMEGTEEPVTLIARVDARKPPQRGHNIRLAIDPDRVHLFSSSTGERVSSV
jgi:multiple sugar transport system ATP-binding protein